MAPARMFLATFASLAALGHAAPTALAAAACPNPLGNKIANGGFESSDTSILPWGTNTTSFVSVVRGGHESRNSLYMLAPTSVRQGLSEICANNEYLLSYYYQTFGTNGDLSKAATSFIAYADGSTASHSVTVRGVQNSWKLFQDYIKFDASTGRNAFNLFVSNRTMANPGVLVDDFSLYGVKPPVVKAGAKEIIANGGFETGKLSPWTQFLAPPASVTKPGLGGSAYALTVSTDTQIVQNITLKPGAHYVFRLDYEAERTTKPENYVQISLAVTSGRADPVTSDRDLTSSYGAKTITQKGKSFYGRRLVAHAEQSTLAVYFAYNSSYLGRDKQPIRIDNISLKEIETPAVSAS